MSSGTVTINLPLSDSLPTATKVALAAAEPEDITFYTGSNATGSVIDLSNGGNLSDAAESPSERDKVGGRRRHGHCHF